jgi:hypothetical protein
MYQALERAAATLPDGQKVVLVECGWHANDYIAKAFADAAHAACPSVRVVTLDGRQAEARQTAWASADVFCSLSDNIQETFGLTPVEAMAAGLPVVISDWNGYKETVRDGSDGYRVPTTLPPNDVGGDLAMRHAIGLDTYDFYIGRTSLATVVDPVALAAAFTLLATQPKLRASMGAAGLKRAQAEFDWPVILQRYVQLADELGKIRSAAGPQKPEPWPQRADPFARFAHFSSQILRGDWIVTPQTDAEARLRDLLRLAMANYAFDVTLLPRETIVALLMVLGKQSGQTVNALLTAAGAATPVGVRCLMWLWKFDLVRVGAG